MSESAYLSALIEALAKQAVEDYLTAEAALGHDSDGNSTQPALLSAMDKAA